MTIVIGRNGGEVETSPRGIFARYRATRVKRKPFRLAFALAFCGQALTIRLILHLRRVASNDLHRFFYVYLPHRCEGGRNLRIFLPNPTVPRVKLISLCDVNLFICIIRVISIMMFKDDVEERLSRRSAASSLGDETQHDLSSNEHKTFSTEIAAMRSSDGESPPSRSFFGYGLVSPQLKLPSTIMPQDRW